MPTARAGDTVTLPDWGATPSRASIAVGQPAHFLLLRPAGSPGTFVVERVIGVGERETTP